MSTRKGKPYTVSYKEKPHPKQDPYALLKAPKGTVICRSCHAIYANKRWYLDRIRAGELWTSRSTRTVLCPACQKIRDDYPEGIVTLKWSALREHEAEIRNLIANVEERALSVNPLERVMKIIRAGHDLEVQTTSDRLAQRLGREMVKAYKGQVTTHWAHQDVLARVTWQGPEKKTQPKGKK
ncbi:MAG: BCAM0308 family protein [Nitrospira sp.]|nr:BCAM0308 family protein [Nitrospira sp.]MCP9462336.1 BCAM0308 family protein [Nitrospira sp.]MCP9474612.1 BCAM0308 family protein [Nitrospira sp.]